jgi:hypothetical protein
LDFATLKAEEAGENCKILKFSIGKFILNVTLLSRSIRGELDRRDMLNISGIREMYALHAILVIWGSQIGVVGVSLLLNVSLCDWVNGFRYLKDRYASVLKVIERLLGLRIPFFRDMTLRHEVDCF